MNIAIIIFISFSLATIDALIYHMYLSILLYHYVNHVSFYFVFSNRRSQYKIKQSCTFGRNVSLLVIYGTLGIQSWAEFYILNKQTSNCLINTRRTTWKFTFRDDKSLLRIMPNSVVHLLGSINQQ